MNNSSATTNIHTLYEEGLRESSPSNSSNGRWKRIQPEHGNGTPYQANFRQYIQNGALGTVKKSNEKKNGQRGVLDDRQMKIGLTKVNKVDPSGWDELIFFFFYLFANELVLLNFINIATKQLDTLTILV